MKTRSTYLVTRLLGVAFFLLVTLPHAAASSTAKPNIIFMLVDDLGWTDLGSYGSKFYETPHIDRLAAAGMRFTDAYSACTVCSPTRASVLTGQYPARLHITDWIPGHVRTDVKLTVPAWTMQLEPGIPNLAASLKAAGYHTASIGKWHLGAEPYWPEKLGFDVNIAGYDRGQPPSYFSPYQIPTLSDGPKNEFLSDRLTTESIKFIEQNKDRQFFLYLPHYAVHTPLMAKPKVVAKYKAKMKLDARHQNAIYAGLIESVDDSVGRLTATLDELHLSERTLFIFTSDNGALKSISSSDPLREGKGSAYEGGVRVPLIVKWPGNIQAGIVSHTPVISTDFFPTLLATAGVADPVLPSGDGVDLTPLFRQSGPLKREAIYWHYPHYHPGGATPYGAVREGDFRLIEFYEDMRVELYNLREDIGESNDLASALPSKAAAMRQKLHDWRDRVHAQMPIANTSPP